MAHKVTFQLPECNLGVSDIVFNVSQGTKKIGTFKVSVGGVLWLKASAREGRRITWSELADAIEASPKYAIERRARRSKKPSVDS